MALKFRRGTTAQQSGSLAFGEPFVNTTLGTLLVGGNTGDIVLAVAGTGSTGTFGPISGSGLDITGNANIAGNLTLGGNITIGDAGTDTIAINADLSSSLIPNNDNAFTIGTSVLRYSNIYGVNIIGSIAATNGVISGSSQLSGTVIPNLSGSFTGSFKGDLAGVAGYASTIATVTTGTTTDTTLYPMFSLNPSPNSYITPTTHPSGSFYYDGVTRRVHAEGFSGSILATNGVVSGSSQVTLQSTTGFSAYDTALATITGSLISSASADRVSITNINSATASALTRLTALEVETSNLETFSGSQLTKDSALATYTGSVDSKFTTIGTVTASYDGRFTSLATITGSLITTASLNDGRLDAIEAVSGTFARTNSANTFSGTQTITGSLYISQDLVVAGSSSIQTISSSRLDIGDNIIVLNVNSPTARFGGLAINDSGSAGNSGSFLYDSLQDEFIFVHKGNGTNVTSSHFILGPETYDNLGSETYLTSNRVPKGTGKEHLNDSQISDDGTTVTIPGALTVTGNITGPIRATNGVVSGSSQVVGSSITTNTITIGSTSTALGGTSTTLAGLTSVSSTGFTGALTGNASTATTLATARTINGTSFNGSADITIPNLVSGSSQVIGILSSLNSYTASNDTTNTSQNTSITNLNTYTSSFAAASVTLTNKTISGASNTLSNIANASLTNSSVTVTAGTGMSGGGAVSLGSSVTLTNAGVTSNVAGTGISVSGATGAVTITNSGVTSAVAGTGVSVSGATGAVTISIGQSVATNATPTFGNLTINGTITATGDITAYYTSDKRHKNNIQTISNAVLKVKQLNGVTWEWNDDVNEVTKSTPKTGLIAQEVQSVLPQVVTERNDGFLALDYSKMVGLLVEAIKEQQIQIDQLKAQIGSK